MDYAVFVTSAVSLIGPPVHLLQGFAFDAGSQPEPVPSIATFTLRRRGQWIAEG